MNIQFSVHMRLQLFYNLFYVVTIGCWGFCLARIFLFTNRVFCGMKGLLWWRHKSIAAKVVPHTHGSIESHSMLSFVFGLKQLSIESVDQMGGGRV